MCISGHTAQVSPRRNDREKNPKHGFPACGRRHRPSLLGDLRWAFHARRPPAPKQRRRAPPASQLSCSSDQVAERRRAAQPKATSLSSFSFSLCGNGSERGGKRGGGGARLRSDLRREDWSPKAALAPSAGINPIQDSDFYRNLVGLVTCWSLIWNLQLISWTHQHPQHRWRDLAASGFAPSVNSSEIVQLIKLIPAGLLPAAGSLAFVFPRSCEVREVGESCRCVCLAV